MDWPVLPDYGIFDRWPVDGVGFIHHHDIAVATRCIPSRRVLCRYRFDGTFYFYRYGNVRFRLRPAMWLKVRYENVDIGDEVEIVGVGLEREKFVARVWGMHYVRAAGNIVYRLRMADGGTVARLYTRDEMRVLTDKTILKPSDTQYPPPQFKGSMDEPIAFE